MTVYEVIDKLKVEGYSLQLIANQSGVNYFRLYRAMNGGSPLKDDEARLVCEFAAVQPCMKGVRVDG